MKNKKGFTLIELLAVVVVIGLLVAIAFPAVSKYTNETRNDAYSLHEAELKTATANMMSKCVQGDVEGCVPDSGGSRTVYLNELIAQKYSKAIKDPAKSNSYCDADKTYVIVTNTKNNVVDLEYQVCLVCSKYQSAVCETVTPDNKCDKTTDPDRPVCGDAIGSSTIWTNSDRVISIGCSDTGCGCTQGTYYQRFEETAKQGVMTIVDKAGNTTDCVVDVYVDKEVPKCELEVVGTQGEHGWYGGTAPVVKFKTDPSKIKDTSGIATYGIGLSSKNPNLNKETSYTVSPGITTVYGYVKDNAGNVGMCKAEVKYDNVVPTSEITYGYRVYPKSDIATTSGQYINLNSFIKEYGNVLGANIYLKSNSGGMSVTIYKGSTEIAKRTISAGVKSMKFTFSGTYDSLKIDMGSASNIDLVDRIELITDHTSGFYTNKDIYVYATSHDSFSGKGYYSFDGEAWQESNRKTYTANVFAADARTKDYAGNISKKIEFTVNNIDKDKPKCTVTTDKAPDGKNNWFISNFGLTLNRWDNQYVTGTNVISEVRDYNITTSTTPSYTTTYKATQTQDTKLTTWHGYIRDRAGNVNTCSIDVKLDKVDPVCNVYPTKEADGENGWYISTVDIKFTEKDDTAGVVFRDLTKSATPSYNMNTQLTLDYDTKGQMFYCYVEDEAGRTGSNKNSYKRDTVDPSCEITPDRNPDGLNNWYLSDVRLTLTTKSDTSPITGYDLTTSTTVNYTGKRTTADITKSTNSVTYYAYTKEESGRISTCNKTIKIDEHNPTCTVTPSGDVGTNSWYVGNITMTLAYDDNETGVATGSGVKKYDVINSNVTKPSSYANKTVNTHTADGTGIIYYGYVQDDAGRTGKCNSPTVKKDATKPYSCTLSISSGTTKENGWYVTNVGLKLGATPGDALSGIAGYDITSESPTYGNKITTYTVTTDSTGSSGTTYKAYIKDNAGNVQSCSVVVKRDTKPPDCGFDISGTKGLGRWYTSDVTAYIVKNDNASGVAKYGMNKSYSVNYNSTGSVGITGNISYQSVYCYVKDNAGWTNWDRASVSIDKDKPKCSIAVSGTKGSNDWYTGTVTLTATTSDDYSGVLKDGLSTSSYASYTGDLTVKRYASTTGTTYTCYVMDRAGNTYSTSKTIKSDIGNPYCYLRSEGDYGKNGWYVSSVKVKATASDYASQLAGWALTDSSSATYSHMSGVSVSGNTATKTHSSDTTGKTYYCYAKDNAGRTTTKSITVKKDTSNPTCDVSASQGGTSSSSDYTFTGSSAVTVSITTNDSTSGVDKYGLSKYGVAEYNGSSSTSFDHDAYSRMKFTGYVMDKAGNEGSCSNNFGRRSNSDACTLTASKSPDGLEGWYKTNVTVTYKAYNYDNGFLGIGASGYQEMTTADTDRMFFSRKVYGSSSSTNLSLWSATHSSNGTYLYEGIYAETGWLEFWGYDSSYCYLLIKKDSLSPSITNTSITGTTSSPASSTAKITLTASDSGGSGIGYWWYSYDGSTFYRKYDSYGESTYSFEFSYLGCHKRWFKVCDKAGNCSSVTGPKTACMDPCDDPPVNLTSTSWGKCEAACGDSVQYRDLTWTGDSGATCGYKQSRDCENYDTCNTAHNLCKDNTDSALFGSDIGKMSGGYRNWGHFDRGFSAKTCNNCSTGISVRDGYERICYSSSCGTYRGYSASELAALEKSEIAAGMTTNSTRYCPGTTGHHWCLCLTSEAYSYDNGGYRFSPFVHNKLYINGTCSYLSEEDRANMDSSDSCY